jgi:acyl-CoA synthetase (NDP forming)
LSKEFTQTLDALLRPRSVALLGVSDDPGKMAGNPLPVIAASGFTGQVSPVNPKRDSIGGMKAYASVLDIPGKVDLALITLPRSAVIAAIDECGRKGVGAAVIITSGFAESGAEGTRLQAELCDKARQYGIRIIGPNCAGMYTGEVDLPLGTSAAFATGRYQKGAIGLITQSGALGTSLLPRAKERNVGISVWFSTGNEMDLGVADLLAATARSPGTRAICLYLEAVRHVASMSEGARVALQAGTPIIALKAGTSSIGAERARAHSGALIGPDAVYDGYFRQVGILRVRNIDHLLPVATVFDSKRPFGRGRMAVFSISGALAGHIADRFEEEGVELAQLLPETLGKLRVYGDNETAGNPYDPGAGPIKNPDLARDAMEALLADPGVDGLVVIMSFALHMFRVIPPVIEYVAERSGKFMAVIRWIPADYQLDAFGALSRLGVPLFYSVDECAVALGKRTSYERLRPLLLEADKERSTTAPCKNAPELSGAAQLLETECRAVLRRYGIPSPIEEIAGNADQAVAAACRIGFPVVIKILSRDVLHKTEVGGVALDIRDAAGVRAACARIYANLAECAGGARIEGLLVQAMAPNGIEAILGAKHEAPFGPVVMIGLGGILAEAIAQVAVRPVPIARLDAEQMLDECGLGSLLASARSGLPADRPAVIDAMLALSQLMADHGDHIEELDINPLRVFAQGHGAVALDALIVLGNSVRLSDA